MKLFFALLFCFLSVFAFSQENTVKLPPKFKNLEFDKTTVDDLGKRFYKPDTIIDNIVEERYQDGGGGLWGTLDAKYYKDRIILHFKVNDTTHISYLNSIDILTDSPISIADSIFVGRSAKSEVKRLFGEPISFNDPVVDEMTFRYKVSKNLLCIFYFEKDTLTIAKIIYNPLFNQ